MAEAMPIRSPRRSHPALLEVYRRLPEELRRCLRPLNLIDEVGSLLPSRGRAATCVGTEAVRRLVQLSRTRYVIRRLEGAGRPDGHRLACLLAVDDLSARYWMRTLFSEPPSAETVGEVVG